MTLLSCAAEIKPVSLNACNSIRGALRASQTHRLSFQPEPYMPCVPTNTKIGMLRSLFDFYNPSPYTAELPAFVGLLGVHRARNNFHENNRRHENDYGAQRRAITKEAKRLSTCYKWHTVLRRTQCCDIPVTLNRAQRVYRQATQCLMRRRLKRP